jgi:quinol monooxygenase YgiN
LAVDLAQAVGWTLGTSGAKATVMVRLTVALSAPSARSAQDLLEALRFVVLSTRVEQGCLGCSAWTDPDSTVRYAEHWATEADMRRRVRSDSFTSLLSIVESGREPRVQFDFVATTRGLDYVAEVRGAAPHDPESRALTPDEHL